MTITSMLLAICAWVFPKKPEDTFDYLRSNASELSEDDIKFIEIMESRVKSGLPLHAQHQHRLMQISEEIWDAQHC